MPNDTVLHVKVQKLRGDRLFVMRRMTDHAAGYDLFAPADLEISGQSRLLVPLGFKVELPPGVEMQIRPRSGLALREGVTVLNAPGTIDPDYRGEVCVLLYNTSMTPVRILAGVAIAQAVFARYETPSIVVHTGDLSPTARGEGGFGSTDQKSP